MKAAGSVSARRHAGAPPWARRAVYGVSIVLIVVSLVLLDRLRRSFESDLNSRIQHLQRVFADRNLLKTPTNHQIRFAAIEELAAKYEGDGTFKSFTVTKMFGEEERIVYPYYAPALFHDPRLGPPPFEADPSLLENFRHPLPWEPSGDIRALPLRDGAQLLGRVFVRVDEGPLNVVRAVLGSLLGLLVGGVVLFALQFRRQERVISRTTVELEEKRRELVRIERLALAGQLSANILHDLKKPVLNIKSEAEELESEPPSGGLRPEDAARRIRQQVELFFGILRDSSLERFVRAESEREYVDVNEILDRSLALVRYERHDVEVESRYAPALAPVLTVPVRLVQVFSNLILNAYQAMDGRGRLTVTTASTPGRVVVEMRDTGPGIPAKSLEQIFFPFFTTKPEGTGTGLGLYITRDILRDLGGSIRAESPAEGGALFLIELPVEETRKQG